ncbi:MULTISPECIES: hypothetical protein [Cyanophyceae]|uniref:hypothetical protein n=1 Tax=Cyanophyceae TaxID=3028117 RepID=UPI00016DC9E4|nr:MULTISPECIES: hypothetical protein [Cyanophyceae]ACA99900.1 conserved hypothetical membrane protein [Picosynechococcus sp. PCC 7002]ANV90909.1 hypothetical protein AWQ24_09840 [Picosynechococcus sp. PCC 8807]QCS50425.1 hypothetical protein FEK30_13900 [Picosynechococcus sp. PCC 11901]SMH54945.1 hypothetical protein SAMN06272755_2877 [Picosynechococcus sp. OG1]SMQ83088.1 hypothetical protein SAMN06272774_2153 [Synechococcus sp. 7002]
MKEQFILWLDRLLVADVFVVLFAFFWFAIALVGRSSGVNLGWDLWYSLWEPVFTPAIGILMLGAILSWVVKKLGLWFGDKSDELS